MALWPRLSLSLALIGAEVIVLFIYFLLLAPSSRPTSPALPSSPSLSSPLSVSEPSGGCRSSCGDEGLLAGPPHPPCAGAGTQAPWEGGAPGGRGHPGALLAVEEARSDSGGEGTSLRIPRDSAAYIPTARGKGEASDRCAETLFRPGGGCA